MTEIEKILEDLTKGNTPYRIIGNSILFKTLDYSYTGLEKLPLKIIVEGDCSFKGKIPRNLYKAEGVDFTKPTDKVLDIKTPECKSFYASLNGSCVNIHNTACSLTITDAIIEKNLVVNKGALINCNLNNLSLEGFDNSKTRNSKGVPVAYDKSVILITGCSFNNVKVSNIDEVSVSIFKHTHHEIASSFDNNNSLCIKEVKDLTLHSNYSGPFNLKVRLISNSLEINRFSLLYDNDCLINVETLVLSENFVIEDLPPKLLIRYDHLKVKNNIDDYTIKNFIYNFTSKNTL